MRTSYTKPNSYAQQCAQKALDSTTAICKAAGISSDEWLHIMFEVGCQFAEKETSNAADALELMTNPSYGFWAAFITDYIADDEWLLNMSAGHPIRQYQILKDDYLKMPNEKI